MLPVRRVRLVLKELLEQRVHRVQREQKESLAQPVPLGLKASKVLRGLQAQRVFRVRLVNKESLELLVLLVRRERLAHKANRVLRERLAP